MKFILNVEVDETQTTMSQKEIVDYVIDSLGDALLKTGAYFDVGCPLDSIVSGLTN